MNFVIDLQLFGGKGGSNTTVQSYNPTPEERRMMAQSADYAEAVAPNALQLNDYAMNLLKNSMGTVKVDYNTMNKNAQKQVANATGNMAALAGSNNNATTAANNALGNISNQAGTLAGNTSQAYGNLAGNYTDAGNAANNAYGSLAGNYVNAANTANKTLGQLAEGNVPSAYQANMEKSIQSALNNTIGKTVSSLGNRGILNSSVTTGALNDIEKNAADTVAQQYQQNINQAAGLAQQQYGNTTNASNSLSDLVGKQYGVSTDTANNLGNVVGKQYDAVNNALGQQAQYAQQQFENTQNNNSQNSGLYSNLINSASTPITTAAGAQEAAISPAQSLWSSSLGLNGATNSALAGLSGKGTTTTTQTMSGGGGGFFSGLLGGVAQGASSALFACFPAGTKITMADGTEKDIRHIQEGDKVMSDDGSEVEVIEVMKPRYNDVYNIVCENGHTSTTLTQPLMKPDGEYIFASDLKIGTELKRVGKVKSIIHSGERKVYDFKTSDDNNYIADGFVAMGGDGSIWGGAQ